MLAQQHEKINHATTHGCWNMSGLSLLLWSFTLAISMQQLQHDVLFSNHPITLLIQG
jgi:hypothetical protein